MIIRVIITVHVLQNIDPKSRAKTTVLETDWKFPINFRNAGFGLMYLNFFLCKVTVSLMNIDDHVIGEFVFVIFQKILSQKERRLTNGNKYL